jgi:hypothetical protein
MDNTSLKARNMQLVWPAAQYLSSYTDALPCGWSPDMMEANGGRLVERFFKPAVHGGAESLRFRIFLMPAGPSGK